MSSEPFEMIAQKLFHPKQDETINFDSRQAEVDERAKDWAYYHGRDYDSAMWALLVQHQEVAGELAKNAWDLEKRLFLTDNPQKQQTRFLEVYAKTAIEEAQHKL